MLDTFSSASPNLLIVGATSTGNITSETAVAHIQDTLICHMQGEQKTVSCRQSVK